MLKKLKELFKDSSHPINGRGVKPKTKRPSILDLARAEKTYVVRKPVRKLTLSD